MLTIPVSVTASSAASADEDLAYLQNTTPFVAIRSVLQYCRSRKLARCACSHRRGAGCVARVSDTGASSRGFMVLERLTSMAAVSAALGTTRNNRDLAGILSGSTGLSSSAWMRE